MPGTVLPQRNRSLAKLGAAHLAWSVAIAAGIAVCLWPNEKMVPLEALSSLSKARWLVLISGMVYLVASMSASWSLGWTLRRDAGVSRGGAALLIVGHLIATVAAGGVLLLGPGSNTLLVSLDRLIATLATVALVSATLSTVSWRLALVSEQHHDEDDQTTTSAERGRPANSVWPLLNLLAALAVAGGILVMESLS